jgi:hypothetical protein
MVHAVKEAAENTIEQTAVMGLLEALNLEHASERTAGPIRSPPRTVVYPMEIGGFMEAVRTGRLRTLPTEVETIGAEISALCSGWERNVEFKVISYEEARQVEPRADRWMLLAQNAALGAHSLILENCPELPKEPGPHAEKGREVLQIVYVGGCSTFGVSKIRRNEGGKGQEAHSRRAAKTRR